MSLLKQTGGRQHVLRETVDSEGLADRGIVSSRDFGGRTELGYTDSTDVFVRITTLGALTPSAPAAHVHSAADITTGTLAVARGGTGVVLSTGSGTAFVLHTSPTFVTSIIVPLVTRDSGDLTLSTTTSGDIVLNPFGHVVPVGSNAKDFGSVTNEFRSGFFGTSVFIGTGQEVEINSAQALFANGVVGAPGISFASDPDSGIRSQGANVISVILGAADRVRFQNSRITMGSGIEFGWSSTGTAGSINDAFFTRVGANQIAIGTTEATTSTGVLTLHDDTNCALVLRDNAANSEAKFELGDTSAQFGTVSDHVVNIIQSNNTRFVVEAATFRPQDSNGKDLGDTAREWRSLYIGTSILFGLGQSVELTEGAADLLKLGTGDSFVIQGGSLTVNEDATATGDLRVEGESLQRLLGTDASAATENLIFCADTAPDFQTMDRGGFWGDSSTAPTGNPTGGVFIYITAGAAQVRGGGGTVTEWGPSGLHCEICGSDFWTVASMNMNWKSWCFICGVCDTAYKGGPQNVLDQLTEQQNNELIRKTSTWEDVKKLKQLVS